MDLNDIPQNKIDNLPMGVSEVQYDTEAEMKAFIDGLQFADDIDVSNGDYFQRDGKFVIRVVVGDWNDEDENE
jgi:hypothetical protein